MNLSVVIPLVIQSLAITSPAFKEGKMIPQQYTCEGKNINPPLTIAKLPEKTASLVLIMDDPDAPGGGFDHWIMYNIKPTAVIKEDDAPGVQGANGRGDSDYTGPCPPSGVHHYHFKVYALDIMLDLKEGAGKEKVESAMKGHILASGTLIGVYTKESHSLK